MRKIFVWLGIMILLGGIASAVNVSADTRASGIEPHSPISINGNQDFDLKAESENWTGNGSESNPYIIKNYDINASSANGIDIRNTTAYFIIKNCSIHGNNSHHGIYLYNVTNVTHGIIESITSENNYYGIYLHDSSGNTITNCAFSNNKEGMHLFSSSNNTVKNCYVSKNPIGIHLSHSDNNVITDCRFYENKHAVFLSHSNNNNVTKCMCQNNSYTSISLVHSSNNIIRDCNISKSVIGIKIVSSSNNNLVYDNTLYNAKNAWDECNNSWNSSSKGNCWSDYNGTGEYSIPGGNNTDFYPSPFKPESGMEEAAGAVESEKIPIIYPVVICVIIIVVCILLYGIVETKTVFIRCPVCGKTFRVKKKVRPFKIECKHCGRKGVLK